MRVLFLTSDLLFQSRVSEFAKRVGSELQWASSPDAAIQLANEQTFERVIVDLTLAGLDISALVRDMRLIYPETRIIAYGPHVQAGRLDAATQAGCDEVLTRGQFDREMARVLNAES